MSEAQVAHAMNKEYSFKEYCVIDCPVLGWLTWKWVVPIGTTRGLSIHLNSIEIFPGRVMLCLSFSLRERIYLLVLNNKPLLQIKMSFQHTTSFSIYLTDEISAQLMDFFSLQQTFDWFCFMEDFCLFKSFLLHRSPFLLYLFIWIYVFSSLYYYVVLVWCCQPLGVFPLD